MKARTLWLSDIHLGTANCQHEKLLQFLKSFENEDKTGYNLEKLYLNGDIFDFAQWDNKIFWTKHRTILKKFIRMADKKISIILIEGNHELDKLKDLIGFELNNVSCKERDIHIGLDGKKYLILHGHQFDGSVLLNPWLYKLGDNLYKLMNFVNRIQNKIRKLFGKSEFSFSLWIKSKVKEAVKFISNFEYLVVEEAKKYDVDGIINGHIHVLNDKQINGIRYLNSGSWVEIPGYIIEHLDGKIEACHF